MSTTKPSADCPFNTMLKSAVLHGTWISDIFKSVLTRSISDGSINSSGHMVVLIYDVVLQTIPPIDRMEHKTDLSKHVHRQLDRAVLQQGSRWYFRRCVTCPLRFILRSRSPHEFIVN